MSLCRRPWWAATATVALLVTGCSTADADTRAETLGLPSTREEVEDHRWRLEDGSDTDVDGPVTLEIDGASLDGATPCGAYHADVAVDREDLEVDDISAPGGDCDERERRGVTDYLAALALATAAVVHGDRLVIEGGPRLEFEEVPDG